MDFQEELLARTKGLDPAADRLRVGLPAVIGRPDGAIVKIFPDGSEELLSGLQADQENRLD